MTNVLMGVTGGSSFALNPDAQIDPGATNSHISTVVDSSGRRDVARTYLGDAIAERLISEFKRRRCLVEIPYPVGYIGQRPLQRSSDPGPNDPRTPRSTGTKLATRARPRIEENCDVEVSQTGVGAARRRSGGCPRRCHRQSAPRH